jgi:hypothetical protein
MTKTTRAQRETLKHIWLFRDKKSGISYRDFRATVVEGPSPRREEIMIPGEFAHTVISFNGFSRLANSKTVYVSADNVRKSWDAENGQWVETPAPAPASPALKTSPAKPSSTPSPWHHSEGDLTTQEVYDSRPKRKAEQDGASRPMTRKQFFAAQLAAARAEYPWEDREAIDWTAEGLTRSGWWLSVVTAVRGGWRPDGRFTRTLSSGRAILLRQEIEASNWVT